MAVSLTHTQSHNLLLLFSVIISWQWSRSRRGESVCESACLCLTCVNYTLTVVCITSWCSRNQQSCHASAKVCGQITYINIQYVCTLSQRSSCQTHLRTLTAGTCRNWYKSMSDFTCDDNLCVLCLKECGPTLSNWSLHLQISVPIKNRKCFSLSHLHCVCKTTSASSPPSPPTIGFCDYY